MIRGERLTRVLSAIVVVAGGFVGASGFLAAPAFAAARAASITPNGASAAMQFTAGGQTGTATVQGLAGQQLTVATSGGTFSDNCGLQLSLLSPTGATIAGPSCAGQSGSVASASLPSDGVYRASLVSGAGATGNVAVAATSSGGPPSITSGAAAVTVAITAANQDLRLGFTAAKGDKYTVTTSAGTLPDCNVSLRILDSSGNPVGSSVDPCAGGSGFAEASISKKATYSVQLLHNGTTESGTVAVALTTVSDTTGTVTTDGTPTSVSLTTPGENGTYTFSGTTGQRVAAELTSSTFGPACPAVALSLMRPDGTALGSPATTCTDSGFLDTQTLDQTGTWSVLVDPQAGNTGSATLQAFTSTDQSAVILRNGSTNSVTLTTPGQNADFTFNGSVGQVVSAELTGASFTGGCPDVVLAFVRPDGSQDTSVNTCTDTAFLDAVTIDQAGTWTVLVDPQGASTGTATLQAFNAVDQMGLIQLDGTPVSIDITTLGQDASLHFTGTTGQQVSAQVTSATFPGCPAFLLYLVRPDGTQLGSPVSSCNDTASLASQTLDQSGTWNVVVDPQGTATGTATLTALSTADQVKPITVNGAPVNVKLTTAGQRGLFTFSGTTGQEIAAQVTDSTFPGCTAYVLSLVRPDSTTLGTGLNGCGATAFLDAQTLDQTGTWTLLFAPAGDGTGTAKLTAYDATDQTRDITLNGGTVNVNITQPGQNGTFTFSGTTGQGVSAQITGATITPGCPSYQLYLVRPDGTQFGNVVGGCTDTLFLDTQSLDQTGTWSIVVDPQGTAKGKAKLQAFESDDQVLPITLNGAQDPVNLGPGQQGFYTFTGAVGQQISAQVSNSTFPGCTAYVLVLQRPDDSQLTSLNGCGASAFLDSITLDQNGTWAFVIQPQGDVGGSAALQAYTFTDQTGTAADLAGKVTKLVFAKPGQNASITFSGTTGMRISTYVSQSTITGCPAFAVSLLRPNGTAVAGPVSTCTAAAYIDTFTLTQTGTWTVFVDPQGAGSGLANLQVYNVVDVTPMIKPGGPIRSFTTTDRGLNAHFRFAGKVGDSRTVTITGNTFEGDTCPGLVVSFVRPDGSVLSTTSTCNSNLTLGPSVLDVAGTWTILVDPQGPAKGTLIIKLT